MPDDVQTTTPPAEPAPPPAEPAASDGAPGAESAATPPAEGTSEAAPAEASAEAKEEKPKDDLAERAAALMRKEGALVRQQQAIRAQEQEIAQAKKAVQELDGLKALAQESPLDLLTKFGVKIEDVKARIAEIESNDPNAVLRRKVEALERQRAEEAERAKQDAANEQAKANLARHRKELADFASANAEKYELVAAYGPLAVDLAQQAVVRRLEKTGDLLSPEQVFALVEKYLDEQYVQPALKSKKVLGRIKPVAPAAPAAPAEAKTLDNSLGGAQVKDENKLEKRPDETNDQFFERLLRSKGIVT